MVHLWSHSVRLGLDRPREMGERRVNGLAAGTGAADLPCRTRNERRRGRTRRHPGAALALAPSDDGGPCNCTPSIRAWVYERKTGAKTWRTFTGSGAKPGGEALGVRTTSQIVDNGWSVAPSRTTFREAAEAWLGSPGGAAH